LLLRPKSDFYEGIFGFKAQILIKLVMYASKKNAQNTTESNELFIFPKLNIELQIASPGITPS